MTGRYEISVSFDRYYTFSLSVGSGRPLLEGCPHSTLPLCRKGIASVRLNCDAPLEDLCADGEENDTAPAETEAPPPPPIKCPKFTLRRDEDGMYTVTLYAKNGKAVAATPPAATREAAIETVEKIRVVARTAHSTEPGMSVTAGRRTIVK